MRMGREEKPITRRPTAHDWREEMRNHFSRASALIRFWPESAAEAWSADASDWIACVCKQFVTVPVPPEAQRRAATEQATRVVTQYHSPKSVAGEWHAEQTRCSSDEWVDGLREPPRL